MIAASGWLTGHVESGGSPRQASASGKVPW